MRILITEPSAYSQAQVERLSSIGEVHALQLNEPSLLADAVGSVNPTILICGLGVYISEDVLKAGSSLRLLASRTTGLDHIDVNTCIASGIQVVSLQGARHVLEQVTATAELTWLLVLALSRDLPRAVDHTRAGGWDRGQFMGRELSGQTLGIVGMGRVGRQVAKYGAAFGMRVLGFDLHPERLPRVEIVEEETLLSQSHILSIHLPLNSGTTRWLDRRRIQLLPRGALVINTARGELLDEEDIVAALDSGHIGGIGVDVLTEDSRWWPMAQGSPVLDAALSGRNVIVTPHIGGRGRLGTELTSNHIVGAIIDWVKA